MHKEDDEEVGLSASSSPSPWKADGMDMALYPSLASSSEISYSIADHPCKLRIQNS
jgi:hypothetical protein